MSLQPKFTPPKDGIAVAITDLHKIYRGGGNKKAPHKILGYVGRYRPRTLLGNLLIGEARQKKQKSPPIQALARVSLTIPAGRIFGLLGPNGAGKSTLINILAGTVIKTAGQVQIWGVDLDSNPRQVRSNIGVVPQELNIDAFFTPRETLEIQAGMFGVPPSQRRTDSILQQVGLGGQADAYARTLSGGMRRRLLVGKAMVHQPPVLVLDEPTAGVDVHLRKRLWAMIRRLNGEGRTIILTTHYLEEAEMLCDEVAILNHGRIIRQAPVRELLAAGSRLVTLTLARPLAGAAAKKAVAALSDALGGVKIDHQTNANTLSIRFNPRSATAGAIVMAAVKLGLEVKDMAISEPDLEDVFVSLTEADG